MTHCRVLSPNTLHYENQIFKFEGPIMIKTRTFANSQLFSLLTILSTKG